MTDFTIQAQTPAKAIPFAALRALGDILRTMSIFAPRAPESASDRAARALEATRQKAEARQRVDNLLR
ncbi:MAG: hypothetical protein AAF943_17895 [Pseudomonadota bacterium]